MGSKIATSASHKDFFRLIDSRTNEGRIVGDSEAMSLRRKPNQFEAERHD